MKISRDELSLRGEGTRYSLDELVSLYREYHREEKAAGRTPLNEYRWCDEILAPAYEFRYLSDELKRDEIRRLES